MSFTYVVGEQYEDDTGGLWEVGFVGANSGDAHVFPPGGSGLLRFIYDKNGLSLRGLPPLIRKHAAVSHTFGGRLTPNGPTATPTTAAFKVGDRIRGGSSEGHLVAIDHHLQTGTVQWDNGHVGYYIPLTHLTFTGPTEWDGSVLPPPAQKACDCGALKAKTPHAIWCSAHESGGTVPFKMPAERLF